jgi:ribosome-binding protein aMBF1 (putative translation factor)
MAPDPRDDAASDDIDDVFPLSEEERAKADDLREGLADDETVIWTVEDGEPVPEVTEVEPFAELEPVELDEKTNAAEDHDEIAWGR